MKLYKILPIVLLFFAQLSLGQTLKDVSRVNALHFSGDARYNAMGGAFGSLGGNISALNNNPASSSVFDYNAINISLNSSYLENNTSYFNEEVQFLTNQTKVNQIGAVIILSSNTEKEWSKVTMGFNYTANAYYNNEYIVAGTNPTTSIADYFIEYANGIPLEVLQTEENQSVYNLYRSLTQNSNYGYGGAQALLGFQGFLLDPTVETPTNSLYVSNVIPNNAGYDQRYNIRTRGSQYFYNFNIATAYKDKLYLGFNINIHGITYNENTTLTENNYAANSFVQFTEFKNFLSSQGTGTSFQFGAILKATDKIRVGLSYRSPIFYSFSDLINQSLEVETQENGETFFDDLDPGLDITFPTYQFRTANIVSLSASYIINKNAIVSGEYQLYNRGNTRFQPQGDDYLSSLNTEISNTFKNTSSLRLGGEYRLLPLSLRAGYILNSSSLVSGDNSNSILSFGIGFDFGGSSLSLSYQNIRTNEEIPLYELGLTDNYSLSTLANSISLTYNIKF